MSKTNIIKAYDLPGNDELSHQCFSYGMIQSIGRIKENLRKGDYKE